VVLALKQDETGRNNQSGSNYCRRARNFIECNVADWSGANQFHIDERSERRCIGKTESDNRKNVTDGREQAQLGEEEEVVPCRCGPEYDGLLRPTTRYGPVQIKKALDPIDSR
jgi:hypothetical protein